MSGLSVGGRSLEELRVVDLKEELDRRGLPKVGKKDVLYQRLKEALEEEQAGKAPEAPVQEEVEEEEEQNPMIAEYMKMQQRAMAGASAENLAEREAETKEAEKPSKAASPKAMEEETPVEEASMEEGKSDQASPTPSPKALAPPANGGGEAVEEAKAEEAVGDEDGSDSKEGSVEKEGGGRKRKWGTTAAARRGRVAINSETLKEMGLGSSSEALAAPDDEEQLELDYEEAPEAAKEEPPPPTAPVEESPPSPKAATAKRQRIIVSTSAEAGGQRQVEQRPLEEVEKKLSASESAGDAGLEEGEMKAELTKEGLIRGKSLSPARHEAGSVLQVRGLTRPFTLNQLHKLLAKFGPFSKENFWIDGIKSHCVVEFDSEESAAAARDGLHNVRWPEANPKLLRCDFSTPERLKELKEPPKPPPAPPTTANEASKSSSSTRTVTTESREMVELQPVERRLGPSKRLKASASPEPPATKRRRDAASPSPPPRSRQATKKAASPPPRKRAASPPKPPAKTLEDLFQKTAALPALYWKEVEKERMDERGEWRAEVESKRAEKSRQREERAEEFAARDREREEAEANDGFPPAPRYSEGRGYGGSGGGGYGGRDDVWASQRQSSWNSANSAVINPRYRRY